ncbi:conserved oligomeric Golgi complex subunit 2 [Microplitis mediator]|uniref:conserved oligomeric Golgi complex subunit 2 n=1 Tax=Microplitis mediator TaxID=375433 RepID=UPI00255549B8|nr:conserved oligomeric Golgi complex subunit 2 [Microplitis mediator]
MTENNFTLPPAPNDLCFTTEDFIALDFDVDSFLHEHRKNASLETMRDDLGVYLKILRSAMIELINKDYADFVNLSKDLIGLDKVIDHLQAPLGQLREEVMQICQTLDTATKDMENGLQEHQRIRNLKQSMHSLGRVYKSVSKLKLILESHVIKLDILERAATEYNQLRFHMTRCKEYISEDLNKNFLNLEKQLMNSLDSQLLSCIKNNDNNTDNLICCLRIYVTIDKIDEAENLVRKKIVSVLIEDIILEKNINNELLGLQDLYKKLLNILDVELKKLLEVTSHSDVTTGRNFNFLVNSFWPEVEEKIELRLKQIFAPGNPDLFYKRYTESLEFVTKLQAKCKNDDNLAQLKSHPLFIQFLKKWNLPVYFQIRFQEIAGSVEQILCHPVSAGSIKINVTNLYPTDTDKFSLYVSETTWECLMKTWSDGIFLPQLLHQFWKLNLQIFSRYRTWITDALKQSWNTGTRSAAINSNIIEPEPPNRLEFLVCLYTDLEKIIKKLPIILEVALTKLINITPMIPNLLNESLDDMKSNLISDLPKITQEIVQELLTKSSSNLKQVSDIPRLFRRTMRERPTQPCAYIKNAVGILIEFHSTYQNIVPHAVIHWLQLTLSSLSEQYYSSVKDVLESVQKTEESLRRLKKIRDKSSGTSSSETQGISDDDKIRIQLEIDVLSFADIVKTLNIDRSDIPHLDKLTEVVDSAVKYKHELK